MNKADVQKKAQEIANCAYITRCSASDVDRIISGIGRVWTADEKKYMSSLNDQIYRNLTNIKSKLNSLQNDIASQAGKMPK